MLDGNTVCFWTAYCLCWSKWLRVCYQGNGTTALFSQHATSNTEYSVILNSPWSCRAEERIHFSLPGLEAVVGSSSSASVLLSRKQPNIWSKLNVIYISFLLKHVHQLSYSTLKWTLLTEVKRLDHSGAKSRIFLIICYVSVLSEDSFFPFLRLLGHLLMFHHNLSLLFYHTGDGLDLSCRKGIKVKLYTDNTSRIYFSHNKSTCNFLSTSMSIRV